MVFFWVFFRKILKHILSLLVGVTEKPEFSYFRNIFLIKKIEI